MNEKDVDEKSIAKAIEELLERKFVLTNPKEPETLADELERAAKKGGSQGAGAGEAAILASQAQPIVSSDWFKAAYPQSEILKNFYSSYKALKGAQKQA
jgi:hypothetical protein